MKKMRHLIWAAAAVLALVAIPLASGYNQEQGNLVVNNGGVLTNIPARGALATVSMTNVAFSNSGDGWVFGNVRLSKSLYGAGMVQIGWFKTGPNYSGNLDNNNCNGTLSSGAHAGFLIESVDASSNYSCVFTPTPTGYTWGQAVTFEVQYLGMQYGNPNIDGDFAVYFDGQGPGYPIYDLNWSPVTQDVYASTGNEWLDATSTPLTSSVVFSNLQYQAAPGSGPSDPFVMAAHVSTELLPADFVSAFTYTAKHGHTPASNVGSINYSAPAYNPTLTISDDFNRPDENPLSQGGNWAPLGGKGAVQVLNNQAYNSSGFTGSYRTTAPPSDQLAFDTITGKPVIGRFMGFGMRIQDGNNAYWNGYELFITNQSGVDTWDLRRVTNGNPATLASGSAEVNVGNRILMKVVGSQLTAYIDTGSGWQQVVTASDSTYTGGTVALLLDGPSGTADDFGTQGAS